jgi:hypothetical protein
MFCKDSSVNQLNELGYNVVKLPREKINPLQVLCKNKDALEILGEIGDFVIEEKPSPPAIDRDQQAADTAGLQTDKFELNSGIGLLKRLLSYLGAGDIKLDVDFSKTSSMQFKYENILTDNIYLRKIEKYLTAVTPDLSSRLLENINDQGELYIITDTLKSNGFNVEAKDSNNNTVNLDIAGLQDILKANFKIDVSKTHELTLSFKGEKSLRFAFKAVGLWLDIGGGKATFRLRPPEGPIGTLGYVSASLINPQEATPVMFGRNILINLK